MSIDKLITGQFISDWLEDIYMVLIVEIFIKTDLLSRKACNVYVKSCLCVSLWILFTLHWFKHNGQRNNALHS